MKAQRKLDNRIVKEKGLQGVNLLDKKILALQVELGELANEWRGFKFWSENQEPRTYGFDDDKDCEYCNGTGTVREHPSDTGYSCPDCEGSGFMHYNPLLEEYVDCLHFILSIGNDLKIKDHKSITIDYESMTGLFITVNQTLVNLYNSHRDNTELFGVEFDYYCLLSLVLELGKMLGFTWEQIEQGYYEKNRINHERQDNNY